MNEPIIREKIHRAVDAYGASAKDDPFLAQRVLAQSRRKEAPHMKKLSTGAIIFIVLMLLSVTALAVGLTAEELWQQSLTKMNTIADHEVLSDDAQAEIPLEEALAIARRAIQKKYGTSDEELDAMGVYPSYMARGWDGQTDDYPSEWDIYYSSRTEVDLFLDHTDYGPTGEYRVYINAETKEVTYCHWYTNDFWSRAQVIWDCGSYDEIYTEYNRVAFFTQPIEQQAYWTNLLKEKGYDVRETREEDLHELLASAELSLLFCDPPFADESDPQVIAAWEALAKQYGLNTDLMKKYAFVATKPVWQTGTDNVCIHFNYNIENDKISEALLDSEVWRLFSQSNRLGMFMVSFEPGTTDVTAFTHVLRSRTNREEPITEGPLLVRSDWNADDLLALDEAVTELDLAIKRMRAAGQDEEAIKVVINDYCSRLGFGELYPDEYPLAPAEANVEQWFAETSEWDDDIVTPEDIIGKHGRNRLFWPMEVMVVVAPDDYRMPNPGETTIEQAIQMALDQLVKEKGQAALDDLGDYTLNCQRVSLTGNPEKVDCRWQIFITDNPESPQNGWKITFGEWEHHIDKPTIQHITDMSNG